MTMANLAQIWDWFMTGKRPTQAQFWESWASSWNKNEVIPQSAISNLPNTLNAKAEKAQFDAHKTAADAHQALFDLKQSLTDKGAQGGYAPLDEFTKLAAEYLNIVDDLVTGGSDALASAETVKTLNGYIDTINGILFSDNVNMDTVQEIVDTIEGVQSYLDTILVDDFTTGGVTKAATAERVKILKALVDGLESSKVSIADLSQDIETDKTSTVKAASVKSIYDWCVGKFKTWILDIETTASVNYTLSIADIKKKTVFTATNPIALNVPTNAIEAIAIGTKKSFTVQGTGAVTVQGAGIAFVQKNLVFTTGDTFTLEKIDTDTWAVNGNLPVAGAKVPYTVFIDTVNGNDASGILGDASKPFLTDTAAFAALPTNNGIPWTFYYIDSGVTRTLSVLSLTRAILYKCDTSGTFDVSATPSGTYTSFYFDCPKSTIKHIGSTAYIAYSVAPTNSHLFRLRCKQLWVEATQMYFSLNALDSVIETEEFYHRNSTNSPIGSGTIKVTKWNTTCANIINSNNASAPLELKVYEFACASNTTFTFSKAIQDFPIQKITGTGTISTANIANVDVTYLEVAATASITVGGTTVLRGKQSGLYLGTIIIVNQGSTFFIQDFYGRITVPTGNNTYGVAFNISRSHINLTGALIYSNASFAWVARTSKIENSVLIQDTPQPLFANFNAATLMTIELYGKNYSNGTLHDGGAAFTVIDKTPNLL